MNRIDRGNETLDQQYSTLWSHHDGGPEPSVADFLAAHPNASSSERSDVLLADQWLRWRSGRPKTVGDYLAEHPSLADDPEAILKLVQGEFLARLDRGETPEPDAYARMFPGLAEPILLQCEVDQWLTMPAPPEPSVSMATTADYPIGDAARTDEDATDDGTRLDPAPGQSIALEAPLPEADFELVCPLGSGGMGEVYEAIQKSLRKRVALKLIRHEALGSPSRVRRFFAEARASARLHHPHIVGVHGIGRMADGRYFLVMDLIEDGTTLAGLLKQEPIPFDRAAELVATVAEAIEHAHSRGVVHRDLKPSNVLLDAEGRPHVTDFGLAKVFDAVDVDNSQTTADQILGTPHYMTPEQADRSRGPITPRTDVFALGGLLYALLTGRPPIEGDSLTAILTRVVSPDPVPTPRALRGDVPAGLERICGTCLEKDAEKRHPSAGAVAEALRAWLAHPEAEDSAAVAAGFPRPTTRSGHEPDADRSRSGWTTDRSLKDGRRTPTLGRWAPKGARPVRSRRWMWVAGAVAAWSVSLVVHAALLSALAFETFTSSDAVKQVINFDSALVGHRDGEQEEAVVYADPDNIERNKAIGDEHARDPSEPAMMVLRDEGGGGEDDDVGGVIVASGLGVGRPSATPRVRGAGRGRINEGSSLPGAQLDGLARSPLSLLPVAPAADLGGGGKIAGDPIFGVKETGVAMDQLAREIIRHLKDHKVTVIWLVDESISMEDDKKAILEKFDRVSSELKRFLVQDEEKKSSGALNHAFVGFGQGLDYMLERPREDIDLIGRAIRKLRIDPTGIENTMRAIREVAKHYADLVREDRKVLIVLVTDESGDDGADVEEARQALKQRTIPLYVIGRQSLFGYAFAHHRYEDPVDDVYHPLIRRGPETADVEVYQWDGLYDRWDEQPSGFAPWELARLTKESGGIYFVLPGEKFMRVRRREQAYSITQLKEYLPEYDDRMKYIEKRNASPLRQALHAVVMQGRDFLYQRDFPVEHPKLIEEARREGRKAEVKLDALREIQKRLESLHLARDREPEKRWQADYDLMLAQTVAFQVKAHEYRALMAAIVKNPPTPKAQPHADLKITWVVDHGREPLAPRNQTAERYAEAERLLEEVIAKHPRTPWADLAQDALDRGFSVKLNEWHHDPDYYNRAKFVPKL